MNVPIHKFLLVTTDGAPAMANENVGLTGLSRNDPAFQDFHTYPTIYLLQGVLIDLQHVMSFAKTFKLEPC
jgi:hypothetical protein